MQGAGFDRGTEYFENKAVQRGEELFQASPGNPPTPREPHFGCEVCHGVEGVGGVATYTITDPVNPDALPKQVQWAAPALNTAMLRYRKEEVRNILVYGRPGTPMPAWGVKGGGPLNDQQIDDLIAYLEHIALPTEQVKNDNLAQYGTDGQKIFEGFCTRCHTQGASYGEPGELGGGAFGPSLTDGATTRQFPAVDKHVDWVAKTALFGQLYGTRGVSRGRHAVLRERAHPRADPGRRRLRTDTLMDVMLGCAHLGTAGQGRPLRPPGGADPARVGVHAPRHQHRGPARLPAGGGRSVRLHGAPRHHLVDVRDRAPGPGPHLAGRHRRHRRPRRVPARGPPGVPRRVGEARDHRSRGGRRPARGRRRAHQPRRGRRCLRRPPPSTSWWGRSTGAGRPTPPSACPASVPSTSSTSPTTWWCRCSR